MLHIQENINIGDSTTMKSPSIARYFFEVREESQLEDAFSFAEEHSLKHLILGGGSNIVFPAGCFEGIVLKISLLGIYEEEDVLVGLAGENWDNFVQKGIEVGVCGIENLSGIPGTVGATPIQNIGAYGVEVREIISWVDVFNIETKKVERIQNAECNFGYRDSFFKKPEGKKYIVLRVGFLKKESCQVSVLYKDLKTYFESRSLKDVIPSDVRKAVLSIRMNKFPDLDTCGTSGSFFKNPIISKDHYKKLQDSFEDIPGYEVGVEKIKVPLAWVLDHVCNLKGYEEGNVKLFEQQPLILVTNRKADANEIKSFSEKIKKIVFFKKNIEIENEVVIF